MRRVLAQNRPVAQNTVRTLLERMEEKGWILHREDGRTFLYSAAQPRQATIGQKVQEVIDRVCGGSAEALVTALLDYRGLSPASSEGFVRCSPRPDPPNNRRRTADVRSATGIRAIGPSSCA